MKILLILNDPPYGTERCYNGLRLASALVKKDPAFWPFLPQETASAIRNIVTSV